MIRPKYYFTIFSIIIILALAACGGGNSSDATSNNDSDTASKETFELDLSHVWPPSHHVEEFVQQFSADVEEATDGQVKITSYPGSTLADASEQVDAVTTGTVDLAVSVHSYTPNEFPLSSVMELPQMATNAHDGSDVLYELLQDIDEFDQEYEGMVPLWVFTSDPGQIFTTDKQVKTIEDLKGLKIRSPSALTNQWLEALGATPVSMPMSENFEALERGVVDGTIAPWEAVEAWGLHEVVNYATVGDFYLTTFYAVMNEDVWDSLGTENQEAIQSLIGKDTSIQAGEAFDTVGESALEKAIDTGVEVYELNDKELEEWSEYISPTIEKWIDDVESRSLPGQDVYDYVKDYMK